MDGFLKLASADHFEFKAAKDYVANDIQAYTFCVTAVYIITIFTARFAMANFKPFQLQTAIIIWNGFLAVFSACGFYVITLKALSAIIEYGFVDSYTQDCGFFEGRSGYWAFMLMVSKTIELGDTLFLVLRKKPLIFLHWYHHALTFNYAIWAYTEAQPFNMYIAWMNYGVHAIMYSYYTLRSLHVRVPAVIARFITFLQILQFVTMLLIVIHIGILKLLNYDIVFASFSYLLCLIMEISYLLLFVNFFYQSYVKDGGAKFIAEKKSTKCRKNV